MQALDAKKVPAVYRSRCFHSAGYPSRAARTDQQCPAPGTRGGEAIRKRHVRCHETGQPMVRLLRFAKAIAPVAQRPIHSLAVLEQSRLSAYILAAGFRSPGGPRSFIRVCRIARGRSPLLALPFRENSGMGERHCRGIGFGFRAVFCRELRGKSETRQPEQNAK